MCECVCYLARVFYQDQTAARALAAEDSALLSALAGMITLFMQEVGATEVACVQGKTVKAGDLVEGFHPHKSHATHPDRLKTQVERPAFFLAQEQLGSRRWRSRKLACQSFPHLGVEPSRPPVPNFLSIIAPPPLTLPKPLVIFHSAPL